MLYNRVLISSSYSPFFLLSQRVFSRLEENSQISPESLAAAEMAASAFSNSVYKAIVW